MKPPSIHVPKKPSWLGDFQAFIMRGNVVDLAVGVIIGAAFTTIVNSLVKDIFNPVLGLALGGIDFSNLFLPLNGQHYDNLADAQKVGAATVNVGLFINAVINFVIVAFVIFWVVRALNKLIRTKKDEPPADAVPTRTEVLLEEIRDTLRRHPAPPAVVTPAASPTI